MPKFYDQNDAADYFRDLLAQTRHDARSLATTSAGMLIAAAEVAGMVADSRAELKKAIDLQVAIVTARAMLTFEHRAETSDIKIHKD